MATSRRPSARRISAAIAVVGALVAGVAPNVACEDSYMPPCRVTHDEVLARDAMIAYGPSLARRGDRVVAEWPQLEVGDLDAGLMTKLAAFEVAVIDEGGRIGLRTTVPVPPELHARLGGVPEADILVEDGAFLVHWIETTSTTEPSGLVREDAVFKVAYATAGDGGAFAPIAPLEAACQRCTMTVAGVALGAESIVFVRTDPDRTGLPLVPQVTPSFVALRIRRDGWVLAEPVPWLGVRVASSNGGLVGLGTPVTGDLSVELDANGRIVVATGGLAWLVDDALHVLAGPVVLPNTTDARIRWETTGEASVAWTVSPFIEGRATGANVSRDLFTGVVPRGGYGIATRERASDGSQTLALDRRDGAIGVVFDANGRAAFAELDAHGTKRGGDLLLRLRPTGANAHEADLLLARGGGRWTAFSLGGEELRVMEIDCER